MQGKDPSPARHNLCPAQPAPGLGDAPLRPGVLGSTLYPSAWTESQVFCAPRPFSPIAPSALAAATAKDDAASALGCWKRLSCRYSSTMLLRPAAYRGTGWHQIAPPTATVTATATVRVKATATMIGVSAATCSHLRRRLRRPFVVGACLRP